MSKVESETKLAATHCERREFRIAPYGIKLVETFSLALIHALIYQACAGVVQIKDANLRQADPFPLSSASYTKHYEDSKRLDAGFSINASCLAGLFPSHSSLLTSLPTNARQTAHTVTAKSSIAKLTRNHRFLGNRMPCVRRHMDNLARKHMSARRMPRYHA